MFNRLLMRPHRFVVASLIVLVAAFISLAATPRTSAIECPPGAGGPLPGACCKCTPEPKPEVEVVPPVTHDICATSKTRVAALNDRKVFVIFSDFVESNPNGMIITEIPFSTVRSVTDAEKASGNVIWLVSKDSEFAKGWHVELYWYDGHYGVQISNSSGLFDDTGAKCGF